MNARKSRTSPSRLRGRGKADSNSKKVGLEAKIAASIGAERRRIAKLLHDGLQQELTLAVLLADTLVAYRSQNGEEATMEQRLLAQLKRLNESARNAIEDLLPESEMIEELLRSSAQAIQEDTVNGERVKRA